jgi:transcriptional regulator with XRE-family HTH domain
LGTLQKRQQKRLQERRGHIGRRLRDARHTKGLSQAELGRIVGCSKSHLSQIESATGTYSFKIFLAVCDTLEVDPCFIFAGVPVRKLDEPYRKFEQYLANLGPEASEFLLSLEPCEVRLLYSRAVEAVLFQRERESGRIQPPKVRDAGA